MTARDEQAVRIEAVASPEIRRLAEAIDGRVVLWGVNRHGKIAAVEVVELADECLAVDRLSSLLYGDDAEPPMRLQLLTDVFSRHDAADAAPAPHAPLAPAVPAPLPYGPPLLRLSRREPRSGSLVESLGRHVRRVNLTPTS